MPIIYINRNKSINPLCKAKMIPISKVALSISLLLTILVALQFNGCESGPFSKATVEITNKLPNLQIIVHCKDKSHDLGSQILAVDQKWSFSFRPNPIVQVTLYFCHIGWAGGDHWFDIYDQERDQYLGHFQPWEIHESGPCRTLEPRECFGWNKGISGGRQLGDANNTIGM